MTLQPLVENAIYHGLKTRKEKGNIYVKGWSENELIHLLIEDDGVGMSEEKIKEVMENEDDMKKGHFGLSMYTGGFRSIMEQNMEFVLKVKNRWEPKF